MSVDSPTADEDASVDEPAPVTACETRPGRFVFTIADNSDAWIASDLAMTPER
ncbi:MAG TPA: hypothetical protein VJ898_01995 [Natrialbaceae archaeon]|nr:hypothetical protein [Natrialbaceae archaeon]